MNLNDYKKKYKKKYINNNLGEINNETFDWKYYINKYEDLRQADITTEKQAYNHWLRYGMNEGRKCNNISDEQNEQNVYNFNSDDYILYFVHLTSTQDFNTGIQKVVRTLSCELNKKKKLFY